MKRCYDSDEYAAIELIGREIDTDIHYDDLFGMILPLKDALSIKPPDFFETNYSTSERSLELFIAPFGENDREGGVMVVIRHYRTDEVGKCTTNS